MSADMVTCALHGRSRLSKFCIAKPVYDAFGKILRTSYECLDTSSCLKGNARKTQEREDQEQQLMGQRQSSSFDPLEDDLNKMNSEIKASITNMNNDDNNDSSSVQLSNVDMERLESKPVPVQQRKDLNDGSNNNTNDVSDVAKIISAGQNRYYDLSRIGDSGKDDPVKKLCFICGQAGHERPKCPNIVCRKCRLPGCNGYPDTCRPGIRAPCSLLGTPQNGFAQSQIKRVNNSNNNEVSSDVVPPFFVGVRCTLCRQEGHIDCAGMKNPKNWKEQCIVCGRIGHYALACPSRRYDRWSDDMRRLSTTGSTAPSSKNGGSAYGAGSYDSGYSGGGGNRPPVTCYNCGQTGHMSRDCPVQQQSGGRGGRGGGYSGGGGYSNNNYSNNSNYNHSNNSNYESGNRRGRNYYNDDNDDSYNMNSRYREKTEYEDRGYNNSNYRSSSNYSSRGGGGGRRR